MLSLAALRYRNIMSEFGGPIANVEFGEFPVLGRKLVLANARLVPGLRQKSVRGLFSDCDGSGVHQEASVARHMAISEALERWAFSASYRSERAADYGFDIDPSTSGMSAFPGLWGRQARHRSVIEAIERFCLMGWWEGLIEGRRFDTDWPGVSAVAINGPFGGVTVIAYSRTQWGGYAYGYAASESFTGACEKAILELARNESVLRSWWLGRLAGEKIEPKHLFERRCVYFGTEEGHELFQWRLGTKFSGRSLQPEVICDAEIPGPWSDYATVWRFALRPPSDGFLRGGDRYFFL